MGQKVNPNSIRLLTNPNYSSTWFTNKKNYSQLAKEDNFVRTLVTDFFREFLYISDIKILRTCSLNSSKEERVKLIINSFFPTWNDMLDIFKTGIELNNLITLYYKKKFKLKTLKKLFVLLLLEESRKLLKKFDKKFKKHYQICFSFIKNKFTSPKLIAFYLINLIDEEVKLKRIFKEIAKKFENHPFVKSLRITVSGGVSNSSDRARTELLKFGTLPYSNFAAKILTAYEDFHTSRGIFGIRVSIGLRTIKKNN